MFSVLRLDLWTCHLYGNNILCSGLLTAAGMGIWCWGKCWQGHLGSGTLMRKRGHTDVPFTSGAMWSGILDCSVMVWRMSNEVATSNAEIHRVALYWHVGTYHHMPWALWIGAFEGLRDSPGCFSCSWSSSIRALGLKVCGLPSFRRWQLLQEDPTLKSESLPSCLMISLITGLLAWGGGGGFRFSGQ